jgi:hypothetical protein
MAEYREIGGVLVRPLLTQRERRGFITGIGFEAQWIVLPERGPVWDKPEYLVAYLLWRDCCKFTSLGIPDDLYQKFFGPISGVNGSSWVDWV